MLKPGGVINNMPAKSQAQFKLMAGICNGTYPDGYRGISKQVACEFVNKTHSLSGLPRRLGHPRTEAERKIRHKRLYGTSTIPPRGTGIRKQFASLLKGR